MKKLWLIASLFLVGCSNAPTTHRHYHGAEATKVVVVKDTPRHCWRYRGRWHCHR